jgi:dienelactone hydrolase
MLQDLFDVADRPPAPADGHGVQQRRDGGGEGEAADRDRVFDIGLLARRLATALQWAASDPETRDLPVGLFGASMGAAAALRCAALERLRDGKLEIVPDASHLFEELGALEDVARRAGDFVLKHLARRDRGAAA